MTMNFARDPVMPRAAADACAWLADSPDDRWVLIDPAVADTRRVKTVLSRFGLSAANALSASRFSLYGDLAPRLAAVGPHVDANALVQSLIDLDPTSPALTLLRVRNGAESLLNLFSWLAGVLVDDMLLHCRFADSRTLPSLLSILQAEQLEPLRRCVCGWGWFGPDGNFPLRGMGGHVEGA